MSDAKQSLADVYEPSGGLPGARVDMRRCRASVSDRGGWRSHQCGRRVRVEVGGFGWCRQHSPEALAARTRRRDAGSAKRRRQWDAEAIGLAYLGALEQTGDPAQAAAAAHRACQHRQEMG